VIDVISASLARLIDVLEDGGCQRLGGAQNIRVDVRLISATKRDPAGAVAAGRFRATLSC
jgi:DNA-binding NtrC family response regulator